MPARAHAGWTGNWRALVSPDARSVPIPTGRRARRRTISDIRTLPRGSTVVLVSDGVGARGRTRRFARAARLVLEREFLAFPSATYPAFVVEATDATVAYFLGQLAFVPPGVSTFAAPAEAALWLARRARGRSTLTALMPSRIACGVRR